MSIDLGSLKLPYSIAKALESLVRKSPSHDEVLRKLEAQIRSLRLLAGRQREIDIEGAERLYAQLVQLLRDTADRPAEDQRLAVAACQYFYCKRDAVPDVGSRDGLVDDQLVADAVTKAIFG
jgi:uncharacterized membrane protein YkvA (DUF1232 family)